MKLNAILVEDEANSREILRNYLKKYCPAVNLIGEAATIKEGLALIQTNKLDLVFLLKPFLLQHIINMPWML